MELSLFSFLICLTSLRATYASTNPLDESVLRSLMDQWVNTPPSWGKTNDPCGVSTPWEGVKCSDSSDSRVTALTLSSMGIQGELSGEIAQLRELKLLDLSYNPGLVGPLPPRIGELKKLTSLILVGCNFTGEIPAELGTLANLTYLALNSNNFSGVIPPALGNLSKLYWLDIAENMLTGPLPISEGNTPGLDQLLNTKHFHFNKNQLSGTIPEGLFSPDMSLIHVLFDGNQFTGEIPSSIVLIKTLEVLRLDRNHLSGSVPSNLNNLTSIIELNLANNHLTGPMPNLTGMSALNYVDLSNNMFDQSETPAWFSELETLTALVIEFGNLHGEIPQALFSFPQLQHVLLDNNNFNGTLDMGDSISQRLQIVNLENNDLTSVTLTNKYKKTLILVRNPVCDGSSLSRTPYCSLQQKPSAPYSTSLAHCPSSCPDGQSVNPHGCICAYPYEGTMYFRAPLFRDVTNSAIFQSLEQDLCTEFGFQPGSVFLQNPFFNDRQYLEVEVKLFPTGQMYFSRSEILRIGFNFSNQTYKPPKPFGPYSFIPRPYPFPEFRKGSSMNTSLIIGISMGCSLLVIVLVVVTICALRQRKRAQRTLKFSKPFASCASSGDESGDIPQLKGARWFSYSEIKKCTNDFSEANEIGSGGYGKVYRGMLPGGQIVAIKRARQGSAQGRLEFKTEIEMLSRVHHRNLVTLVGFCFEREEQMLVYEFVPNGTLRESLSGKSGVQLDWERRLRIALDSARGLDYLHEHADPPIIHRDVKTSNILLDDKLAAKVADFGISKLVPDYEKGHVGSLEVKGTMGYLDPEYYMTQQPTEKSDVYSFGIVMLELICARQPLEKGTYIVSEVNAAIDANDEEFYGLRELMDPLLHQETTHLLGFRGFAELALRCVQDSAADRPTMSDVVKEIEMILRRDGVRPDSASGGSSATEFGSAKGGAPARHPYADTCPRKDTSGSSFGYSGGYTSPF